MLVKCIAMNMHEEKRTVEDRQEPSMKNFEQQRPGEGHTIAMLKHIQEKKKEESN